MSTLSTTGTPAPVPSPAPTRGVLGIGDRLSGVAAVLAGVLSAVIGTLQLMFPQDEDPVIDPRTRVILVMFTISLWALAVLFLGLSRHARSRWGAMLGAAGTVLLTVGTVTSAINGIDLEFFPIVAMAANAVWLVGAIALTVSLVRGRRVPLWLSIPLPVVQVMLVFFSQMGGGILAGVYLAVFGAILLAGRIASRQAR